jgi:hypothetical protein
MTIEIEKFKKVLKIIAHEEVIYRIAKVFPKHKHDITMENKSQDKNKFKLNRDKVSVATDEAKKCEQDS